MELAISRIVKSQTRTPNYQKFQFLLKIFSKHFRVFALVMSALPSKWSIKISALNRDAFYLINFLSLPCPCTLIHFQLSTRQTCHYTAYANEFGRHSIKIMKTVLLREWMTSEVALKKLFPEQCSDLGIVDATFIAGSSRLAGYPWSWSVASNLREVQETMTNLLLHLFW